MLEKSKKRKKGTITEDDISTLLHRYSVDTVLALLQEVAQLAGDKIDWNAMVKNTATGISSAREYQMLWRNLAYGQTLVDQFDSAANPMDDDSDLEYDQEPFPAVSREASMEAAACVKVLIASGCPNDSHLPNNSTIEAPLTINIPNIKAFTSPSDNSILTSGIQGKNISIPVSVQKQPLPSAACGEKRPINETSGAKEPPKRKRRAWSTEEDMKLTAAVQKYGERNWANIARGDFKDDRKATELSQRWTTLRKRQGISSVATSSQLSETPLAAAHRAVSLALDMPMGDSLKAASSVGMKSHLQLQKTTAPLQNNQLATVGPPKSSHLLAKRPSVNPPIPSPDSMVKAAAIAAGARIASSADASSLINAARSQNVFHMKTGGSSAMKTSPASITNPLPSNVHFICNGLAKAPISAHSARKPNISRPGESQQAQGHSMKSVAPTAQRNSVGAATPSAGLPKTAEDGVASTSANEIKECVQRDQVVCAPLERVLEDQSVSLSNQSERVGMSQTSASGNAPNFNSVSQTQDNGDSKGLINGKITAKGANNGNMSDLPGKKSSDNKRVTGEVQGNFDPNGRQEVLISSSINGSSKVKAAAAGDGVK